MSLSSPVVSIVVPIYNVEKYLGQCVDSILTQTLHNIEVILIDDGSPDACPAMVDAYAAADPRVIAIHQPNGGYGKAVNAGIAAATAPYIGIVEPDDYITPDMYDSLVHAAQKHDADVTKCWFYDFLDVEINSHIKPFPLPCPPPEDKSFVISEQPQLLGYHPSVWSCLYKKAFLQKYDIRMQEIPGSGWTDNPFQVQTLCRAKSIVFINKTCYHWRRVNIEAADDLYDYRVPFDRCDEIHSWLNDAGYAKPEILANLYARELAYILIVSRMRNITDMKDCCRRMRAMCRRMKKAILAQAPLNRKSRKAYRLCSLSPRFFIFTRQLRRRLKNWRNIHNSSS